MKPPVPAIPTAKQIVAIREDLCMSFSTMFPKNAADIPKKNIAKLKNLKKARRRESGLGVRNKKLTAVFHYIT